jgi:hypothetical protein
MDSTVFHEMLLLVFPDEQDSNIPFPCAETNEESNKKLNPENASSFKLSFISHIIYILYYKWTEVRRSWYIQKNSHHEHIQ